MRKAAKAKGNCPTADSVLFTQGNPHRFWAPARPGLTRTARPASDACLDRAAEHAGMPTAIREEEADGPVMRCDVPIVRAPLKSRWPLEPRLPRLPRPEPSQGRIMDSDETRMMAPDRPRPAVRDAETRWQGVTRHDISRAIASRRRGRCIHCLGPSIASFAAAQHCEHQPM